mgnify:CR=1 FL=1
MKKLPKRLLAALLALALILSLCLALPAAAAYTDDTQIAQKEAVELLSALKILQGANNTFNPKGILTREQAAKIIAMFHAGSAELKVDEAAELPFTDVAAEGWAAPFIGYCYKNALVSGTSEDTFAPTAQLTGTAFLKMVLNVLGYDTEAEGYTGAMTPPTLPADVEGKYTGTRANGDSVVFNLNRDLTGTYNGVAFTAIYDGDTRVIFTAGGVACVFRTDTLMLTVGEEQIRLTSAGAVTEKIPASMCGTFSGTWTGANSGVRTVVIESDGTVTYFDNIRFTNVTYDVERGTLKATTEVSGETYTIMLTWNAEKGSYTGYVNYTYDGEETRAECQNLTRKA